MFLPRHPISELIKSKGTFIWWNQSNTFILFPLLQHGDYPTVYNPSLVLPQIHDCYFLSSFFQISLWIMLWHYPASKDFKYKFLPSSTHIIPILVRQVYSLLFVLFHLSGWQTYCYSAPLTFLPKHSHKFWFMCCQLIFNYKWPQRLINMNQPTFIIFPIGGKAQEMVEDAYGRIQLEKWPVLSTAFLRLLNHIFWTQWINNHWLDSSTKVSRKLCTMQHNGWFLTKHANSKPNKAHYVCPTMTFFQGHPVTCNSWS